MEPFRPGNIVTLREQKYKIVATNHDGKLILAPIYVREDSRDMMMRLQSTVDEPSKARVEAPKEP
jgi:hypothetical protein